MVLSAVVAFIENARIANSRAPGAVPSRRRCEAIAPANPARDVDEPQLFQHVLPGVALRLRRILSEHIEIVRLRGRDDPEVGEPADDVGERPTVADPQPVDRHASGAEALRVEHGQLQLVQRRVQRLLRHAARQLNYDFIANQPGLLFGRQVEVPVLADVEPDRIVDGAARHLLLLLFELLLLLREILCVHQDRRRTGRVQVDVGREQL